MNPIAILSVLCGLLLLKYIIARINRSKVDLIKYRKVHHLNCMLEDCKPVALLTLLCGAVLQTHERTTYKLMTLELVKSVPVETRHSSRRS